MPAIRSKINPDFSEGVDRKLLRVVRDRFLHVNAARLERGNDALSPKHQDILILLPLLYHVNHPMLPGYVSKDTPQGVSNFEPGKACITIAKSYSQSFTYKRIAKRKTSVHAIYMMGSTGTLAHSEASDVDLWLCYDPLLKKDQIDALKLKASKIDEWANSLGLELHTFLMNPQRFKQGHASGPVDKESSGSAQHYLLLDEFYRTAILLAGRYPIWWLIPPDMDKDYESVVELLLSKRFLKESEVIDFGNAATIPKSELIGAGLWQLYKGLDSPYKSVLKILLAEVYAQELPKAETLSQVFKRAVYDDELAVEQLDPYMLVYKRLEAYLIKRREHKRLDVVQKSFYLKVAKRLSRKPSSIKGPSWQRLHMEKLVRKWGWSDEKFRTLDNRNRWKVDQVAIERQALVAELSFSYRFLSQYARANRIRSSITSEDLNLLGRKLYAIFQKKAGKIERVNPGIVSNLWEENLSFQHSSSQLIPGEEESWQVYRDIGMDSDAALEVPLKKSVQLIEMLAWLYFNGILNSQTRLNISSGTSGIHLAELQGLVRALEASFSFPLPSPTQEDYQRRALIKKVVLFVNLGVDPTDATSEHGVQVLSDRSNALNYGAERINLVQSVDQISINSWNEVTAHRFGSGETLLQSLQAYVQMSATQKEFADCQLEVFCLSGQRSIAITERVQKLFDAVKQSFLKDSALRAGRYILELADKFYILQCVDEQFRYFSLENEMELFRTLAQAQASFSPIFIDDFTLTGESLLALALPLNLSDTIQVFYYSNKEVYQLIVLDEMGSMQRLIFPYCDEEVFQSTIAECVDRMLETRQLSEGLAVDAEIVVQFNRITRKKGGGFLVRNIKKLERCALADVTVIDTVADGQIEFDLLYQGVEFSYHEYGRQQFDALVHYAYQQSGQSDRIPLAVVEVVSGDLQQLNASFNTRKNRTQDTFRLFANAQRKLFKAVERFRTSSS